MEACCARIEDSNEVCLFPRAKSQFLARIKKKERTVLPQCPQLNRSRPTLVENMFTNLLSSMQANGDSRALASMRKLMYI